MRKLVTFILFLLLSSVVWGQGIETFDNAPSTGSTYTDATFTGQDGSTWTMTQCRTDQTITGVACMMGRNRTPEAYIESGSISNGIGSLTFNYKRAFTTNANFEVYVNNILKGTFTTTDANLQVGSIPSINVTGDFVIKFAQISGGGQINIDDITWTAYSGGAPAPEPTNHVSSFSASANGHNQIDLTWNDNNGAQAAAGFLILANKTGTFSDPVDGTAQSNDADMSDDEGKVNVVSGIEAASFTGLDAETQYFFKIFPYTNSGADIDYKTDGTVPTDNATTDAAPVLPNAWINEIHYDNAGTDENEAIEIIIQNSGSYSLADFAVDLYNGNGGASYSTETLNNFTVGDTDPTDNTFTYYYYNYTANLGSIQNGPDGMALSYQGTLIQFLSYGGTFAATGGPAIGVTSTDIGVSESSSPIGESLQLTGSGTQYSDFTWAAPATATLGSPNNNQALPVELTSFSALAQSSTVNLTWETATEVNNYGFEIERTVVGTTHELSLQWAKVGFVEGHGNSNSAKQYSYVDNSVRAGQSYSYRLKQIDFDGQFEYSNIVNVEVGVPMEFSLAQNYPNPFNPSTSIEYSVPSNEFVTLKVYDVLGNTVSTLVNETKEAGKYNVSFDASNLTSGIYFYSINAGGFIQVKKMMLVK